MTVLKDLMANLFLAAGGRGGISTGGAVPTVNFPTGMARRKILDGELVNCYSDLSPRILRQLPRLTRQTDYICLFFYTSLGLEIPKPYGGSYRSTYKRQSLTAQIQYYLLRNFFNEIVVIPRIFDFNCNPLSDVSMIGFSSLYLSATDKIMLSGERLSKSSGSNEVSANS